MLARSCIAALAVASATLTTPSAVAADIGLLGQFSGPYSWWGKAYQRGVELWIAANNGGKVGAHQLKVLERDEGGTNPQRSHQLAQELVLRDKVQYLLGGIFTPTVLGVTEIATQAKTPFVVLNSGTSMVTTKSPYFMRVGFKQWPVSVPLVQYAVEQGTKNAAILVADYAPGSRRWTRWAAIASRHRAG